VSAARPPSRRHLLATAALTAISVAIATPAAAAPERPNVLWLVAEDTSATSLGIYGPSLARTPALDALAARSVIFDRCFGEPVCAPSRFTLITGIHAASCGPAHHMRAQGRITADVVGFPALLRSAGYFTSNNAKTDYNAPIDMQATWDAAGRKAHWRGRPDPAQPFFAVFNHEVSHESCLFPREDEPLPFPPTDPAAVRVPAYQPDTPEIRADWARHADHLGLLDRQIAARLAELAEDGLTDDTIVFFYGDNGGVTPRSKRFLHASGTRVPLLVHVPPRWKHLAPADPGARLADPVGFADFAATVLAIAGVPRPDAMQGRPFAGPGHAARQHVYCTRDRMDERYDMMRSVMDRRWLYIRNFRPDLPAVQPLAYMFRGRGYQSWARLAGEGRLTPAAARSFGPKPPEELYDLDADPDNVVNLAADPARRAELERLRGTLVDRAVELVDNGFLPEGSPLEGYAESRAGDGFPVRRVVELAVLASAGDAANLPRFVTLLDDPCEPIRWWAAQGCTILARGHAGAPTGTAATPIAPAGGAPAGAPPAFDAKALAALERRLADDSPAVRVVAAEALVAAGRPGPALPALGDVIEADAVWPRLQALNVIDRIGREAAPLLPALERLRAKADGDAADGARDQGKAERYPADLVARIVAAIAPTP